MNCSRCDSSYPNESCFVCAEDEQDEPDAVAEESLETQV
jgi:hypothetical protein